jgi:hypothetical protein
MIGSTTRGVLAASALSGVPNLTKKLANQHAARSIGAGVGAGLRSVDGLL